MFNSLIINYILILVNRLVNRLLINYLISNRHPSSNALQLTSPDQA